MSFYRFSMNNASVILFGAALIIFLGTVFMALRGSENLFSSGSGEFANASVMRIQSIVGAIATGLGSATWPFFGAALLYQFRDKRTEAAE